MFFMKLNAEYKELCFIHERSNEEYEISNQDNEALPEWHQMESEGINSSVADKAVIAKEIRGLDIKAGKHLLEETNERFCVFSNIFETKRGYLTSNECKTK